MQITQIFNGSNLTAEELKQKVSVIISNTRTSGNQKVDAIMEFFEIKNPEKQITNPTNPLYIAIKETLAQFGEQYYLDKGANQLAKHFMHNGDWARNFKNIR